MDETEKPVALAVVEVSEDAKVRCQVPNCGRPIYKQVHIVKVEGVLQLIGSECFKKVFFGQPPGIGIFTGAESRKLTDEERALLIDNTQRLIDSFEQEYLANRPEPLPQEDTIRVFRTPAFDREFPPQKTSHGKLRVVPCLDCRKPMETTLTFTPALGHRCNACKALQKASREKWK